MYDTYILLCATQGTDDLKMIWQKLYIHKMLDFPFNITSVEEIKKEK